MQKEQIIAKVSKGECPIEDCGHSFESKDSLGAHIYQNHRKSDVIEALLIALGL